MSGFNDLREFSASRKKRDYVLIFLAISVLIVAGLLVYFNYFKLPSQAETNSSANNYVLAANNTVKQHVPVKLNSSDVLVSFRIDDITFETKQKYVLLNALELAHKYNITFDLAVIARLFDKKVDPAVFRIYQDNQDVFEIVAHGWDHVNPSDTTDKGEFYSWKYRNPVPAQTQEEHIKKMKEVFERHKLYWGTKIFALPQSSGDKVTNAIAKMYGYSLITSLTVPVDKIEESQEGIIITRAYTELFVYNNRSYSISDSKPNIDYLIQKKKVKFLQVLMHPQNFEGLEYGDHQIGEFRWLINSYNQTIKFSFISDRFANEK